MKLLPIQTSDAQYADVERLLVAAFPPEERRPLPKQREYTDYNPLFQPYAVVDEAGEFIGLVTCWRLGEKGHDGECEKESANNAFLYVEHLATVPAVRGKGYGAQIIELLRAQYADKPIVLEVEPPVDGTLDVDTIQSPSSYDIIQSSSNDITHRRIRFYRRCGFELWKDKEYIQPPYSAELPSVPLLLMSCDSLDGRNHLDEQRDFDCVKTEIHSEVYGV